MTAKVFLDTNLWVYFYSTEPDSNFESVKAILRNPSQSILVSTQNLGELFHVLTRKNIITKSRATGIVRQLIQDSPVLPIHRDTVIRALEINDRYSYSYWDSLILATALLNDCEILYSEDMQHNQVICDRLQIKNPLTVNQ